MTRRDDAGVGRARVPADARLLLDDGDLVPVLREVVGGRDPGDAGPQDEDLHASSASDARIRAAGIGRKPADGGPSAAGQRPVRRPRTPLDPPSWAILGCVGRGRPRAGGTSLMRTPSSTSWR